MANQPSEPLATARRLPEVLGIECFGLELRLVCLDSEVEVVFFPRPGPFVVLEHGLEPLAILSAEMEQ